MSLKQIVISRENNRFPSRFLRAFCTEGFYSILFQAQATGLVNFELGQLEAARPKINRQK